MGEFSVELQEIRSRITSHMSMLTVFMSTSQFYVEQRLKEMRHEFREGHMEGSVMSTLTVDSLTDDARSQWRIIRKELENHGISLTMFDANKEFIYHWIERAIKRGAFEEEGQPDVDHEGSYVEVFVDDPALTGSADNLGSLEEPQAVAGSSTAFIKDADHPQPQGDVMTLVGSDGQRVPASTLGASTLEELVNQQSDTPAHELRADMIRPAGLKGLFTSSTTSSKPPQFLRADIIRVLKQLDVTYKEVGAGFICLHSPRYDYNHEGRLMLGFEVMIVKIPLFSLHGIQFKRLQGTVGQYRSMTNIILNSLRT